MIEYNKLMMCQISQEIELNDTTKHLDYVKSI